MLYYFVWADGYINWNGSFSDTSSSLRISGILTASCHSNNTSSPTRVYMPVSASEQVTINYTNVSNTFKFAFHYCYGAIPAS